MTVLLATLGVSVASALVPLINVEAYLGAVAATMHGVNLWALCISAGIGQMLGKIIWYEAGRRSLDWAWVRRRLGNAKRQHQLELWRKRVQGRPLMSSGVLLASAFAGFPPYAVISVLAGQLQISFVLFCVTGLVGRTARFAVVVFGVSSLPLG